MNISNLKKHKMDLGTSIIGIICIAACAIPFVLTSRGKKKREKKILISLKELAKEHQSEITTHEVFQHFAIGLDNSKKTVSFLLKRKEEIASLFIDLSTIKSCEINKITSNNGNSVDLLNLRLTSFDKKKKEILLEFYNADVSIQPNNEFEAVEKWNDLINNIINIDQKKAT